MRDFKKEIESRQEDGLLRELKTLKGNIDFLSNDYLGLSSESFSFKGNSGSTGSRLLSGNSSDLEDLEQRIAQIHKTDSALFYPSGYMANLGLISCICNRADTVIMDELCHASLIDGVRLSGASRLKFKHNDLHHLEERLSNTTGNLFVVVESLYSMDGTESDIQAITQLCKTHNALLIIDEAHSCGISSFESVAHDNVIRVVTYGKAFGSHGAAVLCSEDIKAYLVNFSRPFVYSTAPSPHQVAAINHAYNLTLSADNQRNKLQHLTNYWNQNKPKDLKWTHSESHIQSLLVPGNDQVTQLANLLQRKEFSVLPIRKPTVKEGTERIRFCIHSYNTTTEIDALFKELALWKKHQ